MMLFDFINLANPKITMRYIGSKIRSLIAIIQLLFFSKTAHIFNHTKKFVQEQFTHDDIFHLLE